jgi:adenylylsulfate kinase
MFVRELMKDYPFYECHVKCPVDECEKRDPKGLYKKARKGEITNMTGLTAPYEEPENPELIIDTNLTPLNQCVDQLTQFLIVNKIVFSRSPNGNPLGQPVTKKGTNNI